MRFLLLSLVAMLRYGSSCLAAIPADMTVTPFPPSLGDNIDLRVINANAWIEVDTILTNTVVVNGSSIDVTTHSMPPEGDIRLPSFRQFDLTIELGSFERGAYEVHYKYYGENGNLFIASSTQFTVVPESSGALMILIAAVSLPTITRLTRR